MIKKDNTPEEVPGMSKKHPFRVPENYFEELPMRIQERLGEGPGRITIMEMIRPRLAYAAMIAVLITVGFLGTRYFFLNNTQNSLSSDEILDAIEYFGYEFEEDLLISALVETDIDYFPEFSATESEQIIEYLSDDYIDFSEIMNE